MDFRHFHPAWIHSREKSMKTVPKSLFYLMICLLSANTTESRAKADFPETQISISGNTWLVNGRPTNAGSRAEGLLMEE